MTYMEVSAKWSHQLWKFKSQDFLKKTTLLLLNTNGQWIQYSHQTGDCLGTHQNQLTLRCNSIPTTHRLKNLLHSKTEALNNATSSLFGRITYQKTLHSTLN